MSNPPLIQASRLTKHYYKRSFWFQQKKIATTPLNNVSFTIPKHKIVGLIGESGSGKTTLALGLAGLIPLTSGHLTLNDKAVPLHSKQGRQYLSSQVRMVFQNPRSSLNPRKTIFDTLSHSLLYHRLVAKTDLGATVERALSLVGISTDYLYAYPHQLSGGQLQRISIARALLGAPQLIICDEIVSALDLSMQAQILNTLTSLQQQSRLTYLFISHDLAVVRSFCSELIIMYKGELVESGPTEQIFCHPQHPYTRMLLHSQLPEFPEHRRDLHAPLTTEELFQNPKDRPTM